MSERVQIDHVLAAAAQGMSGVLVLKGEAGAGKTALLDYAVDSAGGLEVVRLVGIESEAKLGFAALGASSVEQGWVLQAWRILAGQGIHYRIVNLSISGATITDVIEREIPAMNGLAAPPDLVTVFIGSNDILHHDLRMNLAARYQALIDVLPADSLIAVTSQARDALTEINRTVAAAAATGAIQAVPVRIAQGKRAEDHFHPSDEGYSLIAADFAASIAARERRTPASDGDETSDAKTP